MDLPEKSSEVGTCGWWSDRRYRLPDGSQVTVHIDRLNDVRKKSDGRYGMCGKPIRYPDDLGDPGAYRCRTRDANHNRDLSQPKDRVVGELDQLCPVRVNTHTGTHLREHLTEGLRPEPGCLSTLLRHSAHRVRRVAILALTSSRSPCPG